MTDRKALAGKLFHQVSAEELVPAGNLLRRVAEEVDFGAAEGPGDAGIALSLRNYLKWMGARGRWAVKILAHKRGPARAERAARTLAAL
jgi:hypothetical protein